MSPEPDPRQYLAYHKLAERYPLEATCYPIERFERLLRYLIDNGFSFFNGSDSDRGEVVITFDDGYAHLADYLPLLMKRYQFAPIIFIPTFWIDKPNSWDFSHKLKPVQHLSADQIKELADHGVIFGSHGHSHTNFRQLTDRELPAELSRSREILQDLTGQPINTISYPFGRYDGRVINEVQAAGYQQGFSLAFPTELDQPLATGRFAVYNWDSPESVVRKLQRGRGYWLEKSKARLINLASCGTILLQRLRSRP
jgi:peptidoglycan/xylan/chitin deacetylase (PgdA/CDA1 family)